MSPESNENLPFFTLNKNHEKLGPRNTHEYDVYSAKPVVIDSETGIIQGSKDIVYKEFKVNQEYLPQGVTLIDYARSLRNLYKIVSFYYPEVVSTDYIIAKNHENIDSIIAVQPFQKGYTAMVATLIDSSLKDEIDNVKSEFEERWSKVINDPQWAALPDYITSTRSSPDFNANNFIRAKDGTYAIIDW